MRQHVANAKHKLVEADNAVDLAHAARALAAREYVRAQRALWRQIPNLAGKALDAEVYGSGYDRVHHDGMWEIFFEGGGAVLVNCRTAEIVDYDNNPAHDPFVAKLSVENLDASKIITRLESDAQRKRRVA